MLERENFFGVFTEWSKICGWLGGPVQFNTLIKKSSNWTSLAVDLGTIECLENSFNFGELIRKFFKTGAKINCQKQRTKKCTKLSITRPCSVKFCWSRPVCFRTKDYQNRHLHSVGQSRRCCCGCSSRAYSTVLRSKREHLRDIASRPDHASKPMCMRDSEMATRLYSRVFTCEFVEQNQ